MNKVTTGIVILMIGVLILIFGVILIAIAPSLLTIDRSVVGGAYFTGYRDAAMVFGALFSVVGGILLATGGILAAVAFGKGQGRPPTRP